MSMDLIDRVDVLLKRLKRYGYTEDLLSFSEFSRCDNMTLFNQACMPGHCLYHLLPPVTNIDNLSRRGQTFILPNSCNNLQWQSLIIRSLFYFV